LAGVRPDDGWCSLGRRSLILVPVNLSRRNAMSSSGSCPPTAQEVRACLPAASRRPTPVVNLTVLALTAAAYLVLLLASVALPWWPARLLAAALNGWMIFI